MVDIEARRQMMQDELDLHKPHKERNMMGQFATPYDLAVEIMEYVRPFCPQGTMTFLEPAIGTGVFYSAFKRVFGGNAGRALGFEVDPYYLNPARELWSGHDVEFRCEDFLKAPNGGEELDLIVTNPPYVRHHHIPREVKERLKISVKKETGINVSGLAGMYCYFMLLSAKWLKDGGLSCWLVPNEFMDVNYGKAVRQYLTEKVDLLQIHRFGVENLKFKDALVSSCVVIFKNKCPSSNKVVFTDGEHIAMPCRKYCIDKNVLAKEDKWGNLFIRGVDGVRNSDFVLGRFFTVKRGVATGDNKFFIVDENTVNEYSIPQKFLRPVLPSPKYVAGNVILGAHDGSPLLPARQYLFTCGEDEERLKRDYPMVWKYIQSGIDRGVDGGYICSRRSPWYLCEERKPAPIVVPYMGRAGGKGRLFRFILNNSKAITTNVYLLLYPKVNFARCLKNKKLLAEVWHRLNLIPVDELMANGRSYGGGLNKLEPRELMNVPVPGVAELMIPYEQGAEMSLFG